MRNGESRRMRERKQGRKRITVDDERTTYFRPVFAEVSWNTRSLLDLVRQHVWGNHGRKMKNTRWLCVVSVVLNIAEAKVVAASLYGPLPPTLSLLFFLSLLPRPFPPYYSLSLSLVFSSLYSFFVFSALCILEIFAQLASFFHDAIRSLLWYLCFALFTGWGWQESGCKRLCELSEPRYINGAWKMTFFHSFFPSLLWKPFYSAEEFIR